MGSSNGDYSGSIQPTTDGGYIVAGYTEGADGDVQGYHGNIDIQDLWIIKLNGTGAVQWKKCLGGVYMETGADIYQTQDGGYIVAGSSASVDCGITGNHGGLDFWLVKLSPAGDIQWQKMLGGSRNEYATSLSQTPDGGYIIGGYTNSGDGQISGYHDNGDYGNNFDWWVVKVDASGNLQWQKTLGGTGDDQCNSVKVTSDGGYIAAGFVGSTDGDVTGNHGATDSWVVKFSSTGDIQWEKSFGGSKYDGANSIQATSDGGYIFAGYSGSNDGDVSGNHQSLGGFLDFWVVKITAAGTLQWQKCYGGKYNENAFYIQKTTDGGYVLSGTAESPDGDLSCNAGLTDVWVIKIDATGNLQWSKSMGGSYYDESFAVQPLPDGSFIAAASTCSVEVPGYHKHGTFAGTCADYWIIKLSPSQVAAPSPIVTLSPASGTVCAGSPATFSATVTNTDVSPSYSWTRNGISVGSNSPAYSAADCKNGDVVSVTVTAGTGVCDNDHTQATASVTVNLNNNILHPDIKIAAGSSSLCACGPATFKATVTGGGSSPAYQWMVNGAPTGGIGDNWLSNELKPADVVTCQYNDSSGCVAGAPLTSNAISLAFGAGVPATVTISGPADQPCTGSVVTFTATPANAGSNPIYQWQVNGINAGSNSSSFASQSLVNGDIVTCTITPDASYACATGGNAVSNAITMAFADKSPVSVNIAVPSGTICNGQMVTLKAVESNAGTNPTYQWLVNGLAAGTNSPDLSQVFNDGDVVQCVITADPNNFCALTTTATAPAVVLKVIDQPNPSLIITASENNACAGSLISFSAGLSDAGSGPTFQWLVNGVPQDDQTTNFNSSQLQNNDVITCSVTPGTGACSVVPLLSNAIVAVIRPLPQVTINPVDTAVLYGKQVGLNAIASSDVVSYQWTPAGLLVNTQTLHPITVPLMDSVIYSLMVESSDQCTAMATAIVKVYRALSMPNAFTPNGDGVNDVFRIPPRTAIQLEEFSIFDRWGNRIFLTRNIDEGWNGTIGGRLAEAGVYVYLIKGTDTKGAVTTKGTVILVR